MFKQLLLILLFPLFLFGRGAVVGYLPNYRSEPTDDHLKRLTHLIVFSLEVNADGTLNKTNEPKWFNSTFVNRAHGFGTKVIICIGGWGRSGGFSSATSTNSTAFVSNLKQYVESYGLDGVDLDWEYPGTHEMASFGTFLGKLKSSLGSEKRVSITVGAQHKPSEFANSTFDAVDAIQLMAYDMHGTWPTHADYTKSMELIDTWAAHGIATSTKFKKSALVLGVPFYTRTGEIAYSDLYKQDTAAAFTDVFAGQNYNGIPTLQKKTEECYKREYGGLMIWEITHDLAANHRHSLLNAIYTKTTSLGGYSEGKMYEITVTAGVGGSVSPSGKVMVDSSKSQTFTITPDQYFLVEDVKVDGVSKGAVSTVTVSSVVATHSVEVTFKKDPTAPTLFVLTTKANSNGSISPSGTTTLASGASKSVTIAPAAGYVMDYVLVDKINRGALVKIDFTNTAADHVVEAFFKKATGGDLGKYDLWVAGQYSFGDTVAYGDRLWEAKWSIQPAEGHPGITGVGYTSGWKDIGAYNSQPDTLITATLQYKSAANGSDTLVTKTDSTSGGKIYGTNTKTEILNGTAIDRSFKPMRSAGIAILRNGLAFSGPTAGTYHLAIYDLRGRELFARELTVTGSSVVATGLEQYTLSKGVYLLRIESGLMKTVSRIER